MREFTYMLHGTSLEECVAQAIGAAGGWIGFDRFMALALYTPGLGYYAGDLPKFGALPGSGSDFVTAPEMTPLFGQTLAVQVAEALQRTGTREVWEFGAGSGALALQLLDALGDAVQRYTIVDLSGSLRARQQAKLIAHAHKLRWVDALPEKFSGVVVGNEVLDAMPVQLLARHGGQQGGVWHERGVVVAEDGRFAWANRPTDLRPPIAIEGPQDYLTEIHAQGEGFMRMLADRLERGAAFLLVMQDRRRRERLAGEMKATAADDPAVEVVEPIEPPPSPSLPASPVRRTPHPWMRSMRR